MTTATTRETIAAAASTVEGVDCSPFYTATSEVGGAWVERSRTTYDPGLHPSYGAKPFWRVVVVMPQDVAAAEQWLEDNQEPLVAALYEVMAVQNASPLTLSIVDAPSLKVLQIDGHT